MKNLKFTLIVALIIGLFSSCAQNEAPEITESDNYKPADMISISEAVNLAIQASSIGQQPNHSRGSVKSVSNPLLQVKKIRDNLSRSEEDGLYIVNYDNDEGFAIISAKRIENPIIGVIEEGAFDGVTDNENFNYALECAQNYISVSSVVQPGGGGIIKAYYTDSLLELNTYIFPMVKVEWGQSGIYGKYCPNGVSGCANTALVQAMSYYNYPTEFELTFDDNRTVNCDWAAMKKHTGTQKLCDCDIDAHNMIGLLMRESGLRADSDYSKPNSTGTSPLGILWALDSFGYDYEAFYKSNGLIASSLCEPLSQKKVIIADGWNKTVTGSLEGHMWVIDGCENWITKYFYYECSGTDLSGNPTYELKDQWSKNTCYYHHNWGWNGKSNGWLLADVFIPDNSIYDFKLYNEFYAISIK